MFLHVCVILFTGGSLQAGRTPPGPGRPPPQQEGEPPWTRQTPPAGGRNPPGPGRPPPGRSPDQADHPPGRRENPPQTRQTTPLAGGRNPPGPGRPPWQGEPLPPGSRLQNMVYERPVRILLECILVNGAFTLPNTETGDRHRHRQINTEPNVNLCWCLFCLCPLKNFST